jgi:TolB protein
MTKHHFYLSLLFILIAIVATACSTVSSTPTPRPATPTLVALATLTPAALASPTPAVVASPTIAPSATLAPTAAITPTRTTAPQARVVVTATARASATPLKPPAPRGNIAYHFNKDGVDRTAAVNLETTPFNFTPLFDIGPVMDVAGTATRGATNAHWGDWSPDNSKIAFILTSGSNASQILRIRDLRTNENRDLESSETGGGGLSSPVWSPNGDKIAYILLSKDERVWTIRYVYYNATSDPTERKKDILAPQSQGQQYRGGLTWGKDGRLALAVNTTGASDIFLLNQDGSGLGAITNNPADDTTPAFSPDGKLIAFTSTRDGNSQIYLMNADGSGARRLSKNTFKEFSPSWSPDGNWIAFTTTRDGQANIYIMDKNGNNAQQITKDGGDNPLWSH